MSSVNTSEYKAFATIKSTPVANTKYAAQVIIPILATTLKMKLCRHCLCHSTPGLFFALSSIMFPSWTTKGLQFIRPRTREGCYYILPSRHITTKEDITIFIGQLESICYCFRKQGIRVSWYFHLDNDRIDQTQREHLHGWILFHHTYESKEILPSEVKWRQTLNPEHLPHISKSFYQPLVPYESDIIETINRSEVTNYKGNFNNRQFISLVEQKVQKHVVDFKIDTYYNIYIWGNHDNFTISFTTNEGKGKIKSLI